MPGWGQSWTDNKMFKLEEEKRRQQAVVKKFIADHPEYDPQNDTNNKTLVDFIEASKRPFTTATIEWAYEQLSWIQKISTALNNRTTVTSEGTVNTLPAGYMPIIPSVYIPYFSSTEEIVAVDTVPHPVYDKGIEQTKTVRRIKEADDD